MQQGDPLGPLLFAIDIEQLSSAPRCKFGVWYLGDGTVKREAEAVRAELSRIRECSASLGLSLNFQKCEIVSDNESFANHLAKELPGAIRVNTCNALLLGAPLTKQSADTLLTRAEKNLSSLTNRLAQIDRHDAFVLLRLTLGQVKLVYAMKAGPCFQSDCLVSYDAILRHVVERVINVTLSEPAWKQAFLPANVDGLGFKCAEDLALFAFIASATAAMFLANSRYSLLGEDISLSNAKVNWLALTGATEMPALRKQRDLEEPIA